MKLPTTSRQEPRSRILRALKGHVRDEAGQSLAETAVSMLVMLMLIFGVIEGCWAVYSFHYLANAAHEATRYAIVRGGEWATTCDSLGGWSASGCIASPDDIKQYAANRGFPGVSIDPANVCVEYYDGKSVPPTSSASTCTDNTGPNRLGDIVQVKIKYPFRLILPGLPDKAFDMYSSSEMAVAQ